MGRFILKLVFNGIALYLAQKYFPGFVLQGGIQTLIIAALVLTLLHTFLRPVIKLITLPLIWLTL